MEKKELDLFMIQPQPKPKKMKKEEGVKMERQIGLFGGIAMIVGTMIGSGIFITPTGLFKELNGSVSMSLIIWLATGMLSTFTALTYIELGTVVPKSGGEIPYFQAAFKNMHPFWGEVPAYLCGFMNAVLFRPAAIAILSLSFGQYAILPVLGALRISPEWQAGSTGYEVAQKLVAITTALLVAAVNCLSARLSARIQIGFTVAKVGACLLVIAIGVFNISKGEIGILPTDEFDVSGIGYSNIAIACYRGLYAYDGWNALNFLTEELVDPERNLPLAILIGMSLVTFLYAFMNVSYFTALTRAELLSDAPIGIILGDKVLGSFSFVIPVLVAMSVFGTANGIQYYSGRISFASAREGHLMEILSFLHVSRLTPIVAIMLNSLLSILFILFADLNTMLNSMAAVGWIFYGLAIVAFFVLRWKQPKAVRIFKVPLVVPIIALLVAVYIVLAPAIDSPSLTQLSPLLYFIVALILYYPFVYKKRALGLMQPLHLFLQKVTSVVPSSYKED